jgi:hypothetical protein
MAPSIEGMAPAVESSERNNNKMSKGYQYPSWKKKLRGLVVDNAEVCRLVEKGIMGLCGVETGEAAVRSSLLLEQLLVSLSLTGFCLP